MSFSLKRRRFLQTSVAGIVGAAIPSLLMAEPPSARLRIGIVGLGRQFHRRHLAWTQIADVAMLCDTDQSRLALAKKEIAKRQSPSLANSLRTTTDFREVLNDKHLDGVVIVTPTHWHPYMSVAALKAGKHVYCEKPLSLSIAESRAIVEAEKKSGKIFQTGLQQRSEIRFQKIANFVRAGRIGEIKKIKINVGGPGVPCFLPGMDAPASMNWPMWTGPSRAVKYHPDLTSSDYLERDGNWRLYEEFGGGHLVDFGVHSFDVAQWITGTEMSGPDRIVKNESRGTVSLWYDDKKKRNYEIEHTNRYDKFMCEIYGTDGIILTDREITRFFPESLENQFWTQPVTADVSAVAEHPETYFDRTLAYKLHFQNWLNAIAGKEKVLCPAIIGHRAVSLAHLCTIAYASDGAPLYWDAKNERFRFQNSANIFLTRPQNEKWRV